MQELTLSEYYNDHVQRTFFNCVDGGVQLNKQAMKVNVKQLVSTVYKLCQSNIIIDLMLFFQRTFSNCNMRSARRYTQQVRKSI